MSRNLSKEQLIEHKNRAFQKLDTYMTGLIDSSDSKIQVKSDKLSYWIEDWTTFLDFEPQFNPTSLRRYKRGEIIKVHLGYNVGSEEGGLHYCVVIDKKNSIHSPVLTVIPLTSVKHNTDIHHLKNGSVYLGNELFTSLSSKISSTQKNLTIHLDTLLQRIEQTDERTSSDIYDSIMKDIDNAQRERHLLNRMTTEVSKMRCGSIALVNQITAISKIRIYDPKTNYDILSNVKLSNEKLDLLDNELIKNYIGKK